ncbi:hypothetical protein KSW81_003202 [Nannochloris sp. 'desiccata']|nr:hypothetical protein KSW81_003202 [Chlorella desiccata (nom. nud.)]
MHVETALLLQQDSALPLELASPTIANCLLAKKQLRLLGDNASSSNSRPRMHHLAVDAICGAVGEVAGLVALYPLDTIKEAYIYSLSTQQSERALLLSLHYRKKKTQTSTCGGSSSASPLVASAAGAAASIVGSFIDAPIEAFKVRAQAGAGGSGSMLGSMASLVVTQGFAPLYCSFLPFLLKSIPHDVAELFTYSQINELVSFSSPSTELTLEAPRATAAMIQGQSALKDQQQPWQQIEKRYKKNPTTAATSYIGALLSSLPIEARDMVIGAASGAAAAIASMPFDVTFTRMNLGSCMLPTAAGASNGSVRHSLANFVGTVRLIVAQGGGPHALFAGVVPRLLQTVPAGMVYWAAVEATRRALENRYDIEKPTDEMAALAAVGAGGGGLATTSSPEIAYSTLSTSDDEAGVTTRRSSPSLLSTPAPAPVSPEIALA